MKKKGSTPAADKEAGTATHIVAVEFKDAPEYRTPGQEANTYTVGDDVSDMDVERLQSLVARGFVVKVGEEAAHEPTQETTNEN